MITARPDVVDLDSTFEGIEAVELDEAITLSETATSGILSRDSCSCCVSTSCRSVHVGA